MLFLLKTLSEDAVLIPKSASFSCDFVVYLKMLQVGNSARKFSSLITDKPDALSRVAVPVRFLSAPGGKLVFRLFCLILLS